MLANNMSFAMPTIVLSYVLLICFATFGQCDHGNAETRIHRVSKRNAAFSNPHRNAAFSNPHSYDLGGSCFPRSEEKCRAPAHDQCEIHIPKLSHPNPFELCSVTVNCSRSPYLYWQAGAFCFATLNAFNVHGHPGHFSQRCYIEYEAKNRAGEIVFAEYNRDGDANALACHFHSHLIADQSEIYSFSITISHQDCARRCRELPGGTFGRTCSSATHG